jgi:hypothetical protein
MHIEYQLVLEDIAAFGLHVSRTSRLSKRRLRFTQASGIFSTLVLVMIWPRWSTLERVLLLSGLCLFWMWGYPSYYRWAIKRNHRKLYSGSENKGVLGNHFLAIGPEGVRERSAVGESTTAWIGIERIEDDEQYLFLYTGPLQAHLIPKRAFATSQEADAFFRLAQTYRVDNTRPTKPCS